MLATQERVILSFEDVPANIQINMDPAHATSKTLSVLMGARRLIAQIKPTPANHAAYGFLQSLVATRISETLNESPLRFKVQERLADITTDTEDILSKVCTVTVVSPGEFHVIEISQEDLFTVNQALSAKYNMILTRKDWKPKKQTVGCAGCP
jgi:hypothetical protein